MRKTLCSRSTCVVEHYVREENVAKIKPTSAVIKETKSNQNPQPTKNKRKQETIFKRRIQHDV
jgi:hypothetical protein